MASDSEVIFPDPQKEYVFPYVIDRICNFLNIRDVLNVSNVCTLWREASIRELNRRKSEILMLPCITTREMEANNVKFHMFGVVRAKPFLALLFFNTYQHSMMLPHNLQEVLQTYKRHLDCKIIAIRVQRSFFKDRGNSLLLGREVMPRGLNVPFGIPSFFINLYKQTNIKITWCAEEPNVCVTGVAKNMYNQLMNISDPWLTMIVFCTPPGYETLRSLLESVSLTKKPELTSIWGCECTELSGMLSDDTDSIKTPMCTVIRIYGSNVKSWTFLITKVIREEYDEHIASFKRCVELKNHTIGLITSRSIKHAEGTPIMEILNDDMQDVIDNLQRFTYLRKFTKEFPTVDFITLSTDGCIFGHNTIDIHTDNNQDHMVMGSVMLITYN